MSNNERKILVALIAGSNSDSAVYEKAENVLKENSMPYELQILSAHTQ